MKVNNKGNVFVIGVIVVAVLSISLIVLNVLNTDSSPDLSPTPTLSVNETPTLSVQPSEDPTPTVVSSVCQSGFEYYENTYFSICYPGNLTLFEEREDASRYDDGMSMYVLFSNSERNDALRIESDGYFDSGPTQCLETENITVDGYEAERSIFKEEATPCGSITYMATIISEEAQGKYLVGYATLNKNEYEIIEQSLKIKKK